MNLVGIATRAFNTPLLIEQTKLDVILTKVIVPRLHGLPVSAVALDAEPSERAYMVTTDGIAVIPIDGTLVRKSTGMDAWSGLTSYEQICAEISDASGDAFIRGILLEIDSPGGELAGLLDLVDRISGLRGTKPIFATVNDMACSAAYGIASACDRIFVTRTACVGSIGVVAVHCDQSKYDQRAGLKYTYIQYGAKKTDGNPHEPLSDRASATIQTEINRVGDLFTAIVARNRNLSPKAVRAQEAGLYFGEDGVKAGLADQIGTPDDAMAPLLAAVRNY